jgi:hypothetical protein
MSEALRVNRPPPVRSDLGSEAGAPVREVEEPQGRPEVEYPIHAKSIGRSQG